MRNIMEELLQTLINVDTQLFLKLNSWHTQFLDYFMLLYSNRVVWLPFYLSFVFVLIYNFPNRTKTWVSCIICVCILILMCDQIASGLLKPLVARYRPSCPDSPISHMVHIVNGYRGGRFGFPSSHASNSFGITFFAIYLLRRNKLSVFLVVWAAITCYSRIYLGVHYPADIFVGILIGLVSASLCYYTFQKILARHARVFRSGMVNFKYDYIPILTGFATIWILLAVSATMLYLDMPH